MSTAFGRAVALAFFVALASAHSPVAAQERLGFRFGFGLHTIAGDLADALDHGIDADFSLLIPVRPFRVGAGVNWASLDVAEQDSSWSQIRFHVLAAYPFSLSESVRPYIEARYTYRRLRPEDDRYFGAEGEELLRDFKASGSGYEAMIGTEFLMNPRFAIDVSAAWGSFGLSPDLSEEGFGPIDSGSAWRLFAGVAWFPLENR